MEEAHVQALAELTPEWTALHARDRRATPFQHPAWCVPWWQHLGGGELVLLQARAGGTLIGLLPGFVWVGEGRRQLMPLGLSHGDYTDWLIDPAHAAAALAGLAEAARADGRFDCVLLPDARPEAWARSAHPAWRTGEAPAEPCPTLVAGDDGLFAAVAKSRRRDLRMAANRAAAIGGAELAEVPPDAIGAALETLFDLSAARWRPCAEGAALDPAAVRAFHHAAAPALAEAGLLRMWRLEASGETAGVYYGLGDGRAAYAYACAFARRDPRQSFGALLIGHAIRAAEAEGAREFHFLRGAERHKYAWGATDRVNARVTLRWA
jgi:CelD/BcsL family acetyltransferase involved in cellulose biosynthesis